MICVDTTTGFPSLENALWWATTSSTLTWNLIFTKLRQEAVALTKLSRQSFECYLPMLRVEKSRRGKATQVAEAMFPRNLFIQVDNISSGQSCSLIRSILGLTQMVRFGGQPPD
jgi:transcriptional antiterminator RfaH